MKWPRGKYNGRRIVGFSFKFVMDVSDWTWKPVTCWRSCGGIHWLCFRTFTVPEYGFDTSPDAE